MITRNLPYFLIVLAFAAGTYVRADSGRYAGCSSTLVSLAEKNLVSAQALLKMGAAISSDVVYADVFLVEAQYCAGDISRAEYCQRKSADADKIIQFRDDLLKIGAIGSAEFNQAKRDQDALKAYCSQN